MNKTFDLPGSVNSVKEHMKKYAKEEGHEIRIYVDNFILKENFKGDFLQEGDSTILSFEVGSETELETEIIPYIRDLEKYISKHSIFNQQIDNNELLQKINDKLSALLLLFIVFFIFWLVFAFSH